MLRTLTKSEYKSILKHQRRVGHEFTKKERSKLKKLTYKLDRDKGMQVYDSLNEMSKHKMKASPYSSRIARSIKIMNYDLDDLDEEVIEVMCADNYIQNFNKENDQLEYLKDIYEEARQKLKR